MTGIAPPHGIERGGYRLDYRDGPGEYESDMETVCGTTNLLFSVGLDFSRNGTVKEVEGESSAFELADRMDDPGSPWIVKWRRGWDSNPRYGHP